MVNYILADYKRVISRVPRLIFLAIYEVVFVVFVLNKWHNAAGHYNSVALLNDSQFFFYIWLSHVLCLVDFIHSFTFDFQAKTIQVALGLGISRLQVIFSKLIQTLLVMLTDLLITLAVFGLLCAITGTPIAGHQIMTLVYYGTGSVLLGILCATLSMPLAFRTQNMVVTMVGYIVLSVGAITHLLRLLTRIGPAFMARLQLDRFSPDSCTDQITANAITGNFQLLPVIVSIAWFALGIYLTHLLFRKMELDF
jgi:ABC-type transport system involved in multi-copper enzyme maturation permease subunit